MSLKDTSIDVKIVLELEGKGKKNKKKKAKIKGKFKISPATQFYENPNEFVNDHLSEWVDITENYARPYLDKFFSSREIIRFKKFNDYLESPYYQIDQSLNEKQVVHYFLRKSSAYIRVAIPNTIEDLAPKQLKTSSKPEES